MTLAAMPGWWAQRLEIARPGAGTGLRSMEGLRGMAVFLVFLVHYMTLIGPWLGPHRLLALIASRVHAMGNVGVDLFFVLSGFLIYGAVVSKPQRFLRFMRRRVVRIYPAFLAVFVLYLGLSLAFPAESRIPSGAAPAALYLLQNLLLLPGLLPIDAMITVAWSLSYEMFYYLVIPVLIGVLGLRDWPPRLRVVLFVSMSLVLAALFAGFGGPARLLMFLSGILLYEACAAGPAGWQPSSRAGVLALLSALAVAVLPGAVAPLMVKLGVLFLAFFVLCLACFKQPSGPLAAAFSWAPLRWLGNMSYSYYLIHGLALKFGFLVLAKLLPPTAVAAGTVGLFWLGLPLMFALTLVSALLLFLVVERPLSLAHSPIDHPATRLEPGAALP